MDQLTVGALRKIIAHLSDRALVGVAWAGEPPADQEPGVELCGFEKRFHGHEAWLAVLVRLDREGGEDEEDEEDDDE